VKCIVFKTLAFTPAWSREGSEAVMRLILEARQQIDALWHRFNPDKPRPYADWVEVRAGGEFAFTLGIFGPAWSLDGSEAVLDVLLELLTRIDQVWLTLNPDTPHPYAAGVRYIPEVGTEEWLAIPEAIRDGGGDCEDLSTWLAAWRRERLGDAGARAVKNFHTLPSGLRLYHIRTAHGDGTVEDASRQLGMNVDVPDGFKPVPGVPFAIAQGMTNLLGAALLGDEYALGMIERLSAHAARNPRVQQRRQAAYLVGVLRAIRESGYDPLAREWVRDEDGIWQWVRERAEDA
jgi:hypothetical protein